jgi:hypothetical protein
MRGRPKQAGEVRDRRFTVMIEPSLLGQLRNLASSSNRTVSDYVRLLIYEHLKLVDQPPKARDSLA